MHIICIHMAMVVMRIAFNIVSCFYLTRSAAVKSEQKINVILTQSAVPLFISRSPESWA
jgi:hypothetical protein